LSREDNQDSATATTHGNVKERSNHLKSESMKKLVIAIQPIEANPDTATTAVASDLPSLKLVAAT
jgi:hypothetical protein